MNEQEILNKAIETYGEESQIDMAIEECSELIRALCKYKRLINKEHTGKEYEACVDDINSEVADVSIMIKQLKIIFESEGSVENWETLKLERLERRLNEKLNP